MTQESRESTEGKTSVNTERKTNGAFSRRKFLRATGGVATAAALTSGAYSAAGERTETRDRQQNRTLRLINATMTSMDPIEASDTASGAVTTQLFDGLLTWPDGEVPVETVIATGYETSEDFTTYRFSLKRGVTYHNGGEVTAQDFVYAWERLAASENSLASDDILSAVGVEHETDGDGNYVPGSMAVRAVDDYTLEVTLQSPFHSALQVLANNQFAAVPEGIVGDIEGYEGEMSQQEFASSNPVGAGPFRFDRWQSGTEAAVTRFDGYHGTVPSIGGVHWQVIEDPSAIYNYSMNRNADFVVVPTSQYDPRKVSVERTDDKGRKIGTYGPLRNGLTANYVAVTTLNVFYIGFNMPSVERPVRRAVAHAMDQHTAVEEVFKGRGTPAYHYTTPSIYPGGPEAYDRHAQSEYPYGYNETQLDEARRSMESAGYGPNNRYELTFTTYQSDTWQAIGQILRDKLQSAHIDMALEQAPFSTLLTRIQDGNVQAFSLGWIVPWAAPDAFVKHLNPATSDPSSPAPESYNDWPDSETARHAVEAWRTVQNNREPTDEAERVRNRAYVTMEEANWVAVANLPVYHEIEERMWYDWVDVAPFGTGGSYRQKFNEVALSERQ